MVDIVILPIKWNEPFGRVVVESVLAGKLVISRKVGSLPELSQILPNIRLVDSLIDEFDEVVNSAVMSEVSEDVKKCFRQIMWQINIFLHTKCSFNYQ